VVGEELGADRRQCSLKGDPAGADSLLVVGGNCSGCLLAGTVLHGTNQAPAARAVKLGLITGSCPGALQAC
jgi:hypothetical protein